MEKYCLFSKLVYDIDIAAGLGHNWPTMKIDPFYAEFGQLLQNARRSPKGTKLTQSDLADAVGLSRSSVANIEKGRQPVQLHLVVRMAQVLGVDISELIPRQPSPVISEESKLMRDALQQQGAPLDLLDRLRSHLPSGRN
jgi:transcriptional regulator with XRE-family HTH domain